MELTPEGRVEVRPDGSKVFTHGHRMPDNTQVVVQEYDPQGVLRSVKVQWTGFAGRVLDLTATLDGQGKVVKEEGYRAPEATMSVLELIKPLPQGAVPQGAGASASGGTPKVDPPAIPDGPVKVPDLGAPNPVPAPSQPASLGEELRKIYGVQDRG